MSKVICKICGAEEESDKWILQTKEMVEIGRASCRERG